MGIWDRASLGGLMAQVMKMHYYRLQAKLQKLGIYQGQPPILFLLWEKDGRSQKEFADCLRLKPATITVMLKRMEKAGWVQRRPDPEDMRVIRVYLTPQGESVRPKVEAIIDEIEDECFKDFSQEELLLMRRLFMHMRDNLVKGGKE